MQRFSRCLCRPCTSYDYTGFSDASRASIQMTHAANGPTVSYDEAQRMEREKGIQRSAKEKTRIFLHETKEMLRIHWMLCIYAVLLMTGMFQVCSTVILTAFPSSANPAFVHQASTSCLMDRKTCTRRTCKLQKDSHQTMPLQPLSSEIAYVQLVLPYPAKKQLTRAIHLCAY